MANVDRDLRRAAEPVSGVGPKAGHQLLEALLIDRKTAVIFALTFLANLGYGVMIPSLSLYASSIGASRSFIGMIVSAFAAAQLLTQIPVGRLSDRIGRKRLVAGGFGGVAVAAALYNFATGPGHFFLLQGLAGVAVGFVWPPLMALLTDDVSPSQRGKLMGIFNTIFFVGVGVGPLLGGYIAAAFGYMATFNVWAAVSVLGALFCLIALKDPSARRGAAMTGSKSPEAGLGLLRPGLWPTFAAGCAVRARGGFCTSFNNSLLPLYAVALFDASPEMIGSLMFVHGLMLAFFNLPGGMMSDRVGRRLPALLGSLIATAGVFWYSVPGGFGALLVAVGLAGAGSAFATPAVAALTADVCNPDRRGEAFGYFLTSFYVGMVLGALIFGFVSDLVGLPGAVLAWGMTSLVLSLFGAIIRETGAPARVDALTPMGKAP
jgi:MFS family permease